MSKRVSACSVHAPGRAPRAFDASVHASGHCWNAFVALRPCGRTRSNAFPHTSSMRKDVRHAPSTCPSMRQDTSERVSVGSVHAEGPPRRAFGTFVHRFLSISPTYATSNRLGRCPRHQTASRCWLRLASEAPPRQGQAGGRGLFLGHPALHQRPLQHRAGRAVRGSTTGQAKAAAREVRSRAERCGSDWAGHRSAVSEAQPEFASQGAR